MNTNENKKKKIIETLSIKKAGILAESVYDPQQRKTSFCVRQDDKVDTRPAVSLEKVIYKPISGENKLLEDKAILLPRELGVYKDENELLNEITAYIHKYVAISPEYERIASHYVLLSWVYDYFNEVPYLRVLGNPGSGKTRFLEVVGSICYKSTFAGGSTTPAAILRMVDQIRGTMILDEANYAFSDMTTTVTQVLNQGYSTRFPVMRVDGKNGIFSPKSLWVYGPKIIATRERFQDDALESRCLSEVVIGPGSRTDIPTTTPKSFEAESLNLRNKLLAYRFNFGKNVINKKCIAIREDVHPRIRQIFYPLISVSPSMNNQVELANAAYKHHRELIEVSRDTTEYAVLSTLLELYKKNDKPRVQEVLRHSGIPANERTLGEILRKKLRLKTTRTANGYVIPTLGNIDAITEAKRRFEITENEQSERTELITKKVI